MKTILLIGLVISVFLAGMVTADVLPKPLPRKDVEIPFTREQVQALRVIDLNEVNISALTCVENICTAKLYKKDVINKIITVPLINRSSGLEYPEAYLLEMRNNKISDLLGMVANATIERLKILPEPVDKLGEGRIIVIER